MAPSLPPFDPIWLEAQEAMGGHSVMPEEPAPESRQRFDAIFESIKHLVAPKTDAVSTRDVDLNSNGLKIRVYTPTAAANKGKLLPLGLYIHAGGWFAGSIEHEDPLCRYTAEHANVILVSPEYRRSPENPYPAGLDDCCTAYEWMHNHAAELGGDVNKKTTMGASAAGNLALAVAVKYADTDLKVKGLITAALAACHPEALPEEYKKQYTPELYADAPMIGNDIVALARSITYLTCHDRSADNIAGWYNAAPEDPLGSPLLHPNLKLIPRIYIAATTKDPTHQETYFLSQECKKLGVEVDYVEWVGWPHYFWVLPHLPKSTEFMNVWCEKLKWLNSD